MFLRAKNPFLRNYIGIIGAIIVIGIFLSIASPYFLKLNNFRNIGNQISINLIIAIGMTLIITTGGIDLSVGANVALTGVIVAIYFRAMGESTPVLIFGLLLGVGVGAIIGYINGFIITKFSIQPFIATLGLQMLYRGLALVFSNGRVIYSLPENFESVFGGFIGGVIPKPIIMTIIIAFIGVLILDKTTLGRYAKAIGGNEKCVEVCGINVSSIKIYIYMIGGIMAAVSGLVLTSTMNAAEPIAGNFYELDAVAVVVIGGTNLNGGKSTVIGTVLGALLLGFVKNGLNIMEVPPNFHQLVVGIIILLAIIIGSRNAD